MPDLRAPFPWFGGKSRAASLIWARFGDVPNYVEPFAGSLAVLLGRPHAAKTETVNDLDAYVVNFWRAVQADPDAVWRHADQPVYEADLHARHVWLLAQTEFRERMLIDPEYFDAKIAGWWVWGISSWIGDGWCDTTDRPTCKETAGTWQRSRYPVRSLPYLASRGQGICTHARTHARTHAQADNCPRSLATGAYARGRGGAFDDLADRLRDVRIVCGDWARVLGPSVTTRHGVTAVLLDPPYDMGEHSIKYSASASDIAAQVRTWAIEHGDDPRLRIALCGYLDGQDVPSGWTSERWKAQGGYGSQSHGRGRENAKRESIWFSPHCLQLSDRLNFDEPREFVHCARHRGVIPAEDTVPSERGPVCRECALVLADLEGALEPCGDSGR